MAKKFCAEDALKVLMRHFINYDYKLCNTFMFGGWESDFFAMSTSGYCIEVEVKVSRSDFFVDFKKGKHKQFADLFAKKSISVQKEGISRAGDILIRNFREPRLVFNGYSLGRNNIKNGSEELVEYSYRNINDSPFKKHTYIVNDWDFNRIDIDTWRRRDIVAPATRISYLNLETVKTPNQFWYAVPRNLVKLEEVPDYAGLIYLGESATVVRRAPYLHKRKMDLTRSLLIKFYNLWQYKLTMDEKIEIFSERLEDSLIVNKNTDETA